MISLSRMTCWIGAALIAASLAGCNVGPKYQRPVVTIPVDYRGAPANVAASPGNSFGEQKWFDVFQDPQLQALIREAVQDNYDVRIAATRILAAQAEVGIVKSDELPSAAGLGAINNNRNARSKFLNTYETSNTQLALGFQWSLDFWGRYRNATSAARSELLAEEWAKKEVLDSLVASIASSYFTLRDLDLQLEISQKTLETNRDSLKLTQVLVDNGATSLLDVRQAEQSVYGASAVIPLLEKQIQQTENLLSTLIGRNPGEIMRGLEISAQPHMPEVPAGLPSALLQRRPDVRETEARLMALNARIGVARAAFFPTIALTGVAGTQSVALTRLFAGPAGMWTFVGSLAQPLFNGGAIKQNVELAKAQEQEGILDYQQTIQQAFREVSDALVAYAKDQEARQQQELLAQSAREARQLSDIRYRGGASSYLEVLDSNTRQFAAELLLAQAQLRELQDYIQLYHALGGGWDQ
jgi:outer membrane protein, multidrug efflux system